ncbi:MAG: hypothetical protein JO165_03345 [Candidatus Eremiobacteraeota bacterium]|nr:hypothetical protein [Candidatus Eremiobacteraeota bacterium]
MSAIFIAVSIAIVGRSQSQRVVRGVPLAPNVHCGDPDCGSYNVDPYILFKTRYGIGCLGKVPPGTTPNPQPPPQSYAVADIGKRGFPNLTHDEADTVARIRSYIHSNSLRIAWVDSTTKRGFIVFDATDGPCEVWALGYPVLNGSCNEFYEPGENPYATRAGPGCFPSDLKRPWMTPTPR